MRPKLMLRLRFAGALAALAFTTMVPESAQAWQFPHQPTDWYQDCRPRDWLNTDEGQAYVAKRKQGSDQLGQYGHQCDRSYRSASSQWVACYNDGERRRQQFWSQMDNYRDQAKARYDQARDQCEQVAKQNARVLEQQKQQARENERRQQEQQADNQRRVAEAERSRQAAEAAQRQAQTRQLEQQQQMAYQQQQLAYQQQALAQQQRAQVAQAQAQAQAAYQANLNANYQRNAAVLAQLSQIEARQPRVIAQAEPSYYDASARNEPRVVQTPAMAAQSRADDRVEAQRAENLANLETGKALRDMYDRAVDVKKVANDPSTRGEVVGSIWPIWVTPRVAMSWTRPSTPTDTRTAVLIRQSWLHLKALRRATGRATRPTHWPTSCKPALPRMATPARALQRTTRWASSSAL